MKKLKAFTKQVGGSHYTDMGVQPLELVYMNKGYVAFAGACYVKVIKYIDRKKDNEIEQLKKARDVLDKWIEVAEEHYEENTAKVHNSSNNLPESLVPVLCTLFDKEEKEEQLAILTHDGKNWVLDTCTSIIYQNEASLEPIDTLRYDVISWKYID